MNRIVMIYSDRRDPLMSILNGRRDVDLVDVSELCKELVRLAYPRVCALNAGKVLGTVSGSTVLNRVFDLRGTAAETRLQELGLHEGWLHWCINLATRSAIRLAHDGGQRGVSRLLLPLNAQWRVIRAKCPWIAVPRFAFGRGRSLARTDGMRHPMVKSVWSLTCWREERYISNREATWDRFVVDRPAGEPVVTAFAGAATYTWCPGKKVSTSRQRLEELAAACRTCFHTEIGEILTYWMDGAPMFASYSPYLALSGGRPEFRSLFLDWCDRVPGQAVPARTASVAEAA